MRASDANSSSSCLRATDEEGGESKPTRAYASRTADSFTFLGQRVCGRAMARLLGVGQSILQKLRQGEAVFTMKTRARPPKHPGFGFSLCGEAGQKWQKVVQFLWFIYHSQAEFMPTDFVAGFKRGQMQGASDSAFPSLSQDEEILRSVNSFMASLHRYNSDVEVHLVGPGFFKGERRYLQHGSRTELFYEYRAFCSSVSDSDPASFSTFLRIANKVVGPQIRSGHLKFRKGSEHAVCDTCVRLKQKLRFSKGTLSHNGKDDEGAIRAWTSHILSQWLDRQVYWAFRTLSQTWFRRQMDLGKQLGGPVATSALCIMQDGMDQGKFRCLRLRKPKSKTFSMLFRPALHVSGTWVHGKRLLFAVSDESARKDAAAQLEQLSRALDQVFAEHGSLPPGLNVQCDNTYREGKNRFCVSFYILLVGLSVMRWITASFLRVGHSRPTSLL